MNWNWQLPNWPNFSYDISKIDAFERQLLGHSGLFLGVFKHLDNAQSDQLRLNLLTSEGLSTAAIEGELLNRESLRASIARHLGLKTDSRRATPAEQGMAEMMVDAFQHYDAPLTEAMLCRWHAQITLGRQDLSDQGRFRTHPEPMLIVSQGRYQPTIHFEAPPSDRVNAEMGAFIEWFNQTAPDGSQPLTPIVRAGVVHIYFESIHPFEDGNGRIGRALSEKALAQSLRMPIISSLSSTINANKKTYYAALGVASATLSINDWLVYFSETILSGVAQTQKEVEFLVVKAKFFDQYDTVLNDRQRKVLLRMFQAGPKGFEGGLSAEKYRAITKASPATVTRDLNALVEEGLFIKTGELRYTRYYLKLNEISL